MDEARAIAHRVLEHVAGITQTDILSDRPVAWGDDVAAQVNAVVSRLAAGEPLQYITGEADFYGYVFAVNKAVLIPRPETELLIDLLKDFSQTQNSPLKVLDIGTGSGCIAITTALVCAADVQATDVSTAALAVARSNAERLQAPVTFHEHDILMDALDFGGLDVVVSNPPYIAFAEKAAMRNNVVDFEPHSALFVPDDDALVFYRALAVKAHDVLRPGGMLCVEINERFGPEVRDLFARMGYGQPEIFRDLSGKDRIVKAYKI